MPVRLLLALVAIASAAAPVLAGDEEDCFQGQDPELRIKGCTEIIERGPKETTAYHNRAVAYSLAGDIDKAIADYTKVIKIAPDNASAYANRSRAYASIGDYASAAADKARAQELMAKANAQPNLVTRKGKFLPSESQTTKSPPKPTPIRNPKPPLKVVPPLKAEPPLQTELVLKTEPAPKASNTVVAERPPTTFWSWLGQLGGKKEPPRKAAPALKVEPTPKAEPPVQAKPALVAERAPNNSGQEAPPDTLLAWLQQLNGKKEPPPRAGPALKAEPAPKVETALKAEPAPDDDSMDGEAPPDTLLAWLKQLNGKKAEP
jgi:tetratricopeptide (TPR) repeat protein